MKLPAKATMREDKWTGMKDSRRLVAKKGESVLIYNTDHSPVFLCTNHKGETFSCNKDLLTIK